MKTFLIDEITLAAMLLDAAWVDPMSDTVDSDITEIITHRVDCGDIKEL